jgi:hypothetical protein
MTDPTSRATDSHDADLAALSSLPRVDLDRLQTRAIRVTALRELRSRSPATRRSLAARYEPALLYALSAAQMLWAAARVLALLR